MKYPENREDVVAAYNAIAKETMSSREILDLVDTLKNMLVINKTE